jgi:hypothetical protein
MDLKASDTSEFDRDARNPKFSPYAQAEGAEAQPKDKQLNSHPGYLILKRIDFRSISVFGFSQI